MTPTAMQHDQWQRVERLYHAALTRPAGERGRFLEQACAGDAALCAEVLSLLAQPGTADGVFARPAFEPRPDLADATQVIDRATGTRIGPYRIETLLGRGGMGEVYRARDARLGRDIAIKILPRAFTADPERLSLFEREARALAALNHPNVATIHGIEEAAGIRALVMELVEGETLAERIGRGPMAAAEALPIARQIAEALAAAHERGIVHRDLKPANIKITPAGRVKVLDFGLAKAVKVSSVRVDPSGATTVDIDPTREGLIVGTAAYMSPEQARGQPVGERTDIWAFGCVLYELLAGRSAFGRGTMSDTIAAVLGSQPDWDALPGSTPPAVRRLLRRCLEKDPSARPHDFRDAGADLESIVAALGGPRRWRSVTAAAGVAMAIAAALLLWWTRATPASEIPPATWQQVTFFPDAVVAPGLSPDGRLLTFLRGPNTFYGPAEVYVKLLPDGAPVPLTGDGQRKMSPVFTPDGTEIAYTVVTGAFSWDTWVVPALGGRPRLLLSNAGGLVWTARDRVLFAELRGPDTYMGLVEAHQSRADARDVYWPGHPRGMAHRAARSPDGAWILAAEMETGNWGPCRLLPADARDSGRTVGPPGACTYAAWSPDGAWMYFSANADGQFHTWRQRFPTGRVERLTAGPGDEEGLAVHPDGSAIYTSVGTRQSAVVVGDGTRERQVSTEGFAFLDESVHHGFAQPFSHDGTRLLYLRLRTAYPSAGPGSVAGELWSTDLETGRTEELLPGRSVAHYDLSRGGRLVVATQDASNAMEIWFTSLDRRSPPERLPVEGADSPRFTPDGDLLFRRLIGRQHFVYRWDFVSQEAVRVVDQPVGDFYAISPDGKWIVTRMVSGDESGARTVALSVDGGDPVSVCINCSPVWTADGRFLSFTFLGALTSGPSGAKTVLLALSEGNVFPSLPPTGFAAVGQVEALPEVVWSREGRVYSGPGARLWAASRETVQRNIYRIPLP